MSELMESKEKKVIAFYLPQFHRIPENDQWWGEGFTEWTNTKKAKPLFDGHYQPKTPLNEDYYDLSDVTVMERQATLAKEYGLYGFCYYHYWFKNGKKLLEKPVENMLNDPKVDIPFCLCWANENWTRNWDGGNFEVIAEQEYGNQAEWEKHFDYLLPFFKDDRYIKYQGKPLMVIYKPDQIYQIDSMLRFWRKRAIENGLPGLLFLRQHPGDIYGGIDYAIKFQPISLWNGWQGYSDVDKKSIGRDIKQIIKKTAVMLGFEKEVQKKLVKQFQSERKTSMPTLLYDYDEAWDAILNQQEFGSIFCSGAFVSWDNTARNKHGRIFHGASPEKFKSYFSQLLQKDSAMNLIFINAWNEWGEGAYLEPDEEYGYAYLDAIKACISNQ